VEQRLAAAGLRRAALEAVPRWVEPQTQQRILALRPLLEELGPLFSRFGRYLSTRLDQLAGVDCRNLASLPDRAEAMPENDVRALLRSELGVPGLRSFAEIDPAPFESLALSQTHRARLSDGRAVWVRLARASVLGEPDLAVLPQLAPYLSSLGWPLPAARRVLDDFVALVERRLDLRREADALGLLAGPPSDGQRFGAPRVVRSLSSPGVLTLELPPGAPLGAPAEPEATALTRALADLWMHLVFEELQIPEELQGSDLRTMPSGALVLSGALFHALSRDEAEAVWRYLVATARDDPDAIFEALRALTTETGKALPETLRHQMGHVVPRRDGRFGEAPPGFPELLLSHWLQCERHGLLPNPALLAFYRGLICLREVAGPTLSSGVLRESLQVSQISRGTERLRRAIEPGLLTRGAEGVVKLLTDMPRLLERGALRRPAPAPPPLRGSEGPDRGLALLAAWLLLAATASLWFHRLPTLLGAWTETAQAGVLALLGVGLLRWIWRSG
jgi:hypothetical protein